MDIQEIEALIGRIVASLGGGTVIVSGGVLACRNKLSEIISKRIELRYDEKLAEYESKLQRETDKVDALTNHIIYISKTQFDKEFSVYQSLWSALVECRRKLSSIIAFYKSAPLESHQEQESRLQDIRRQFTEALDNLNKEICGHAPFYKKEIYDSIKAIEALYSDVLIKIDSMIGSSSSVVDATVSNLEVTSGDIESKEDLLCEEIRTYLHEKSVLDFDD